MTPAPPDPPAPPRRFRIVAALDLSEYAEIVLEHALDQAARHDAPFLHFLAVDEHGEEPGDELKQRLTQLVVGEIDTFRDDNRDWRARLHVRAGKPAEQIAELAGEVQADLLVVGRFGVHQSRTRRHIGSVAEQVLALAPCPTLVVQLTQHVIEPERACPACAELRERTDGESWFCAEHAAPDRIGSAFLPIGTSFDGGGLMW
jgi:nucleotide-binding universal stress UspA family protein